MSDDLRWALDQVARRFRRVRLWGGLALGWLLPNEFVPGLGASHLLHF